MQAQEVLLLLAQLGYDPFLPSAVPNENTFTSNTSSLSFGFPFISISLYTAFYTSSTQQIPDSRFGRLVSQQVELSTPLASVESESLRIKYFLASRPPSHYPVDFAPPHGHHVC
jgi:hypothetical protein